ncbi:membrane-associated zinc metalloprotease [Marinicauda salina]|uniref:Membrane-associated zinc metalloprotease n=1 Tax=Marinicauda salina TaxID=2135793 RepID=A0A2U2BT98_9PROT|nr:M50 family metallopeptidase [Marinicauda salina]PWE17241.1 membrane-associated zinc metalloprotease [Marinicauda salina]
MIDLLGSGLLSLFAFVAVISFVIVIHELGHYGVGRLFGVHAEAFSIGFGPVLAEWRDGQGTRWRISALPLGGFVKFRGDENAASAPDRAALEQARDAHGDADTVFHFKPVWQRALIVLAGPAANFVLAIAVFAVLGAARGEVSAEPLIGTVIEDSAAEAAGFQPGDRVLEIDGAPVRSFTDITESVYIRAGQTMRFLVDRDGRELELVAEPQRQMREDGLGGERAMGFLGVGLSPDAELAYRRYSVIEAPAYGVRRTAEITGMILDYIGRLVTGRASVEHINGPLGIATTAGQIANQAVDGGASGGAAPAAGDRVLALVLGLVTLAGLLSVALGLMNLLPIPVLDGGHLVYYAYEAVAQRPPSPALQAAGFRIGLALVLGMLFVATWNDVSYLRGLFS